MSYQDFYDQCEMKPYKYKNFKLAYDKWNKNATPKTKQSFEQIRSDEVSDKVDTVLNSGFNPFNPEHYEAEEEVIDVQLTK